MESHIRWIIRQDLPEVVALDGEWSVNDLLAKLRERNCIGMVAEEYSFPWNVVGFMVYNLFKDHIQVVRMVGVSPEIKVAMCKRLTGKLARHRREFWSEKFEFPGPVPVKIVLHHRWDNTENIANVTFDERQVRLTDKVLELAELSVSEGQVGILGDYLQDFETTLTLPLMPDPDGKQD